jgi:hypothetical protein
LTWGNLFLCSFGKLCQQFHKYQQNEQVALTSKPWNKKGPGHIMLEIQVMDLDRHTGTNMARSQPSPLDNWISNNYTDLNKQLRIGECPSNSPFLKNDGAEAHCFLRNGEIRGHSPT